MGYQFGKELHKTYSSHPHYYLTESKDLLIELACLRKQSQIAK